MRRMSWNRSFRDEVHRPGEDETDPVERVFVVVAVIGLIGLQILLSWLCVRSQPLNKIINGEPVLLMHRGRFLREAMRRERVASSRKV